MLFKLFAYYLYFSSKYLVRIRDTISSTENVCDSLFAMSKFPLFAYISAVFFLSSMYFSWQRNNFSYVWVVNSSVKSFTSITSFFKKASNFLLSVYHQYNFTSIIFTVKKYNFGKNKKHHEALKPHGVYIL